MKPACTTCGGVFYKMTVGTGAGRGNVNVIGSDSAFGAWSQPEIVEQGSAANQLYSQITWRFYDIFFGIVMVFDAETGSVGPAAGHVHCRLSWSPDGHTWSWVDAGGLNGKEFIPAGAAGSFDSHVCFAAHSPIKMPDGSVRLYYMGTHVRPLSRRAYALNPPPPLLLRICWLHHAHIFSDDVVSW